MLSQTVRQRLVAIGVTAVICAAMLWSTADGESDCLLSASPTALAGPEDCAPAQSRRSAPASKAPQPPEAAQ